MLIDETFHPFVNMYLVWGTPIFHIGEISELSTLRTVQLIKKNWQMLDAKEKVKK